MVIQLKASDSFVAMVSRVKRVKAIILCEGSRDAEVLKALARRLGFVEKLENVAVTDAEGFNALRRDVFPALLALIVGKVVGRPKPIAVVVDADAFKPEERVKSFVDSLESRGYRVPEHKPACNNVWMLRIQRDSEEIPLIVAVNGVFEEPFTKLEAHELEDHLAYLKLLENRLSREKILEAKRAEELVTASDTALLDNAGAEHVEEAFKHITCLLQALTMLIQTRT